MSDPEVFMSGSFDAAFLLKKVKKNIDRGRSVLYTFMHSKRISGGKEK
jgi:hypothetical protein